MARFRVIILEKRGDKLHYAMWADVPAARQPFYADASKVSVWKDALPADNAALQSGAVTERIASTDFEAGAGPARIKQELETLAGRFQAEVNAYNPWSRYGTAWDGATWTNGGVA